MQYVTATDAKQRLAALLDLAQREPVTIRSHNRDVAIVMSPLDYDRLRGTNLAEQAAQRISFEQMIRKAEDKTAHEGKRR